MARRTVASLLVLAALAVAPAARANTSVNVEAFGGWQNLRLATSSVGNAVGGTEGTGIVGGNLLLDLSGLGLGISVDKTVSGTGQPWAGSILGGLMLDLLPAFRLQLLGELGRLGSGFDDLFKSSGATFVGLRPGVSFRVLPTPFRLGVDGIVRWPTSGGDIGSPTYGIVGKVAFEIP